MNLFRVSRPEPIIGGCVKQKAGALQRRRQRSPITQIALAQSVRRVEICARARWTRQHPDVVAADPESGGDRRTEKTTRARHQYGRRRRLARGRSLDGTLAQGACRSKVRMSNAWPNLTIHLILSLPDSEAIPKPLHRGPGPCWP